MSSTKLVNKASKKISQNDLRRLMSDHKKKLQETTKRVESPLAKYLDDGTLTCIVCDSVVRSEAVWSVHINAKKHKDNIALRKSSLIQPPPQPIKTAVSEVNTKKRPTILVKEELDEDEVPTPPKKLKGILKNAPPLPDDFFDTKAPKPVVNQPADKPMEEGSKSPTAKGSLNDEEALPMEVHTVVDPDLPEGFFDDPVLDAKARNVEYKDPIQDEWDKFQKEIKEENTVSAQIIQDDTEVATVERQIIEVDEQLRNWSRVLDLEKKKEIVQASTLKARDIKMEINSSSSDDGEDIDEFLDWRAKKSYR